MSDELNAAIKITADASGVEAGVTRAKRSLAQMSQAADQAGELGARGLGKLATGSTSLGSSMDRVTKSVADNLRRQIAGFDAVGGSARQYQESLARIRGADVNGLKPLLDQFEAAKARADAARTATDSWSASLGRLGPLLGTAFAGASLGGLSGTLVSVQREFDKLNASLITITGGSAAAAREMRWLTEFAKETPFGLAQATQGFVKMKALGLDPTRESLNSFGNTAAAMGKDLNQMIEAVADASTSEFERLKEFGIKAKQEGSQVSLTFQGVTKTIGSNSREIVGYLEAIGNTQFAGAMELRAKTLDGAIAGLGDSWDGFFRTVNDVTGASEAMRTSVVAVSSAVDSLGGALRENEGVIDGVFGALAGAGAAAGIATLPRAIGAVSAALTGLAAIAAANPVALAVLGVGAVVGGGVSALRSYSRSEVGIRDAIQTLEQQNAQSEQALRRALDGGRAAGADNIRKTIDGRVESIRALNRELHDLQSKNIEAIGAGAFGLSLPRAPTSAAGGGLSGGDAKAASRELAEQAKLMAELSGLSGSFYEDWNRLTVMFQRGALSVQQLTAAQADLLAKQPAIKAAADEMAKAVKSEADAAALAAKSYADAIDARQAAVVSIQQQIAREAEAAAVIGLTRNELAALEIAKLEDAAASKLRQAAAAEDVDLSGQLAKGYRDEAKALRELAAAKRNTSMRQESADVANAAAEAAQKAGQEWLRYTEDINRSLTDALMRGFEDGKGYAENLRDTVENMFKTMVLRPVISAVMQPVSGLVSGAMGAVLGTSGGGGGNGVLGAASTAKDMYSLYSAATGYSSGVASLAGMLGAGGAAGAAAGSLGYANLVGAIGGDALGAFIAGNAAWGGVGVGAAASAGAAAGAATGAAAASGAAAGASAAGGASSAAGAAAGMGPYGWVAAAAILAVGLFMKDDSGTLHSGAKARYSAADGLEYGQHHPQFGINIGMVPGSAQTQEMVGGIARSLVTTFDSLAKTFGRTGGYEVATGYADDSSKDGAWGALRVSHDGREIVNWDDTQRSRWAPKEFSNGQKGYEEFLDAIAADTKRVLGSMDLPGWAQNMVSALDDAPGMEDLAVVIAQMEAGVAVLDAIGGRMTHFASFSDAAVSALIQSVGSIEALSTATGAYYQNYYSDAERTAAATADMSRAIAALGLTMPSFAQGANAARAQYRALVDSIDVSTEQGQRQYLGLLNLQGAFAELTPLVDQAAEAARSAANALQQRQQLEGQLLQLQGNTAEIRRRQLAELADDQNRAIQQAIYDLQDTQAAEQAAARVKAAWQGIGDTIADEIRRIRGEMVGSSAMGLDGVQAQFAIATAQARSGDQDAAASLPELSRIVLELARENATSAAGLSTFQAQIASSLEETVRALAASRGIAVPAFAAGGTHSGGWAMVGERGPELAYMPPAQIYNASQTSGMLGGTQAVVASVDGLRQDLRQVAGELARLQLRVAKATEGTNRMLDSVTEGGDALRVTEVS